MAASRKFKPLDILFLLAFSAVCVFSFLQIPKKNSERRTLVIKTPEGKFAYDMATDRTLEFDGLIGKTRISIYGKKARFDDSACDNKTCVLRGELSEAGQWAACLPNGIMIYIEGEEENPFDALAE